MRRLTIVTAATLLIAVVLAPAGSAGVTNRMNGTGRAATVSLVGQAGQSNGVIYVEQVHGGTSGNQGMIRSLVFGYYWGECSFAGNYFDFDFTWSVDHAELSFDTGPSACGEVTVEWTALDPGFDYKLQTNETYDDSRYVGTTLVNPANATVTAEHAELTGQDAELYKFSYSYRTIEASDCRPLSPPVGPPLSPPVGPPLSPPVGPSLSPPAGPVFPNVDTPDCQRLSPPVGPPLSPPGGGKP